MYRAVLVAQDDINKIFALTHLLRKMGVIDFYFSYSKDYKAHYIYWDI